MTHEKEIHELSKEVDELKKEGREAHRSIQSVAKASQESHESMIGISKELRDLKKKEKDSFNKFVEKKEEYNKLLEIYNQKVMEIELGEQTIDDFLTFLLDWFVNHTISEDKKSNQLDNL